MLPVDVAISNWDSTLEGDGSMAPVRLGLSLVRGMREESAARIEAARAVRPFSSVNDLANRAQLDRHDLQVLADANALASLSGNRREALWQAVAAVPDKDLLRATARDEELPALPAPDEGEEIVSDYRSTGLTLNRHPLALLRERLDAKKIYSASTTRHLSEQPACPRLRHRDSQTTAGDGERGPVHHPGRRNRPGQRNRLAISR